MSSIPFKAVPASLRTPLFYAELDPSRANTSPRPQRSLLIGQKSAAGTLTTNELAICRSQSDTRTAAGAGSILAGMIDAYRANDPDGELWVLPLADDVTATAATGTISISGSTTSTSTLSLYVAGTLLPIALAAGTSDTQIAVAIAATINATTDLPVTAAPAGGTVTVTSKNRGELANDAIHLQLNYLGLSAGENSPPGISIGITFAYGGFTNPTMTVALSTLQDMSFDFIVSSLTDMPSLTTIATLLNDSTGRWAWSRQVYGHAFAAMPMSAGTAASIATALNSPHLTVMPYASSPTPSWRWSAAMAATAAVSLRADPGRPLQGLALKGIVAPPLASRLPMAIRNSTLLYGGCSTWTVDAGATVRIENLITTYVSNSEGLPDDSYLQIETLYLLMYILRRLADVVSTKYGRVKLAADGTRLLPGSNVVTPAIIRADIIAMYRELEGEGMVQNSAAFAAGLTVEKSATNPNRVDVRLPAVLINQLRVFATLVQFRLM